MKQDRLFSTLTDIDDDLIEEAALKKVPIPFVRIASVAAAAAVLVSVALLPWGEWTAPVAPADDTMQTSPTHEVADNAIGTVDTTTADLNATIGQQSATEGVANTTVNGTTTVANTTTKNGLYTTTVKPTRFMKPTAPTKDEIALIPKWEDKTVKQKYPEIPYGAATYSVYYPINPKQVGDKLTTVTATGQDVYTDTYHTTKATLYRLADIAPQCAVAIQYEGDKDYYSAVATWYQPLTLGEFVECLQLEKYGEFGDVSWDYFDEVRHYRTYSGITKEAIFDLLLDDLTLANVHDDRQHFVNSIDISVNLPILGLENPVVMMLSEDGYLFTNLLGCGKTFHIGTARVEAFKDYLQKNGTVTEYTLPTEDTVVGTREDAPANSTTIGLATGTTRSSAGKRPE